MALKPSTQNNRERKTILIFDPEKEKEEEIKLAPIRKKRVAAYARVSTEQDAQQNSYDAQIKYYTDYIKSKPGWVFVKVYSDDGVTGTSYKKRGGFNEMVADAKAGKIDLILTKSISRFSRNTVDSLSVTRDLKSYGVEVYFEKENISSMDAQAELVFTIMSSIAQEESRSISDNVRWGQQRSMEAGKVSVAWKSFLGYEKGPDGLPKIVEKEAEIVRRIYREYIEGKSFKTIAEGLTRDKIKTPMKKDIWVPSTVRSILQNEKYMGDARLQKTYTVDFLTKEVRKNNGEVKQWYVKNSHEAIISSEDFEYVQQEIQRRTARGSKFYDSPFSNKVRCGCCGDYYGHRIWHSAIKKYRREVWICNKKYEGSEVCNAPSLSEKQLQTAFVIAINRLVPSNIPYIEAYEQRYLPFIGNTDALEKKLKGLNNQIRELAEQAQALIQDNAKRAQNQEEYNQKFDALSNEIDQKKLEVEAVKAEIATARARKANFQIFVEEVKKTDFPFTRFDSKAWHRLVEYAVITPENNIDVHFRSGEVISVSLDEIKKAM